MDIDRANLPKAKRNKKSKVVESRVAVAAGGETGGKSNEAPNPEIEEEEEQGFEMDFNCDCDSNESFEFGGSY